MDKQKTILIVEDDVTLMKAIVEKFGIESFKILQAFDGEEGLKIAIENRPDLVLLDIVMPKMGGLTMLRKLREDEWGKNAEVIILTNYSDDEKAVEAKKLGAREYLIKTEWKIGGLLQKVREELDK